MSDIKLYADLYDNALTEKEGVSKLTTEDTE